MFEEQSDRDDLQLRARMSDLEERLNAALDIVGLLRPAATILGERGVDESGQRAVYTLVDELTSAGVPLRGSLAAALRAR